MPFFIITLFLKNEILLKKVFLIFIVATSIDSLVAIGQLLFGYGSRGWGFGGNTLNLASLLCVIMPILLIIILDDRFTSKTKSICKIAFICCFVGLLAGKSRGAWLTLAVMLPIVSYIYIIRSKKTMVIFLIICLGIGGFFASSDVFKQRLESISNITTDSSNVERILVWKSCLKMISDYPVFGVGMNEFKTFYDNGYRDIKSEKSLVHAHNNALQIASESGLVGLFGFLYLACYIFFKNFNEWRKTKNPYSLMLWGAWLGFMIFGMFDLTIDHSAITKAMWFLFGCILVFKNKDYYI